MQDFYDDPEVETVKKLLLDLEIKLNIFEQKKNVQACFWFVLFNFMTPITAEIEITTAIRKIPAEKHCQKVNLVDIDIRIVKDLNTKNCLFIKTNVVKDV